MPYADSIEGWNMYADEENYPGEGIGSLMSYNGRYFASSPYSGYKYRGSVLSVPAHVDDWNEVL